MKVITLEELKRLCDEYDEYHGMYRKSKYEGGAVFGFVKSRISSHQMEANCEVCKKPVKLVTVHYGYCCGRRQTLVEEKS